MSKESITAPIKEHSLDIIALAIMLPLIFIVDYFNIPNPNVVLLAGLVYVSFLGGYRTGIVGALLIIGYSLHFFSIPGQTFHYTPENLNRVIIIIIFVPIMVLIVGRLKRGYDTKARELLEANSKLLDMTRRDSLTGLYNKGFFSEVYAREYRRALREEKPLSLLMVDIDQFKEYNDTYGHIAGDDCLIKVARILHDQVNRPMDLVARYGGEEFIILLPDSDKEGAETVARRILERISSERIPHCNSIVCGWITVSIGCRTFFPAVEDGEEKTLLDQADQALYQAKSQGKNQIVFYHKNGEACVN